jgi:hypothetical protein
MIMLTKIKLSFDEIYKNSIYKNFKKKYEVIKLIPTFTISDLNYVNDTDFYFLHLVNDVYGINKIFCMSNNFIFDGTHSMNLVTDPETNNLFSSNNKKFTFIKFGYKFKTRKLKINP